MNRVSVDAHTPGLAVIDPRGLEVRAVAYCRNLIAEVRYLPGLEIHLTANGEERHVVEVQAGRNSVRLEHWVGNPPVGIDNDYLVYGVSDHLRSSLLELDEQAAVISDEGYRPYGERAWWIAHQGAKASYKTRGYSGKQRDATGLIYYGFRYYAPWLLRWINPDPAGEVDGLNLYCFVRNSPVRYFDWDGLVRIELQFSEAKAFFEDIAQRIQEGDPDALEVVEAFYPEGQPGEDGQLIAVPIVDGNAIPPAPEMQAEQRDFSSVQPGKLSTPAIADPRPSTSREAQRLFSSQARTRVNRRKTTTESQARPRKAGSPKKIECKLCNIFFSTRSNLNRHALKHSGVNFPCEYCPKVFSRRDLRVSHVKQVHTKDSQNSCSFCEKLFLTPNQLNDHINIHTGEKPYKCALCPAEFGDKGNLNRHRRVHTAAKAFGCEHCDKRFGRSDNLKKHQQKFHKGV
ncbi:RHS repeat-associated core domain-containing protein [Pseudomonas sp. S2_E01]